MEIKLYIRQNPVYNLNNQQVYYSGTNPHNLVTVVGALPANRQWQNYNNFIDVTDYVEGADRIKLTWSLQRTERTNSTANPVKKSASGSVTFQRLAYDLIRQWLVDDVSASLNSIEVKIEDTSCGMYEGYIITSQDVSWCEGDICEFQLVVKQKDELISCLQRTVVGDNWQGWFQKIPANGKKHPRISYCNEIRPNATLAVIWYLLTTVFMTMTMFIVPVILAMNPILFILNLIKNILNANWNIPPLIKFDNIFDGISSIFIESAGCGREHPSALIRDYISNVCSKCGVSVNANTFPLFFAPTITVNTSTGLETFQNEYYNAVYFNAPVERGIRRFKRISINFGFQQPNTEYYIPENTPRLNLPDFLDKVLPQFNHEWKLVNGSLVSKRKDEMQTKGYIYDFSDGSADRSKLVEGVCFQNTGEKYPASCVGIYAPDASDKCGNEAGNSNGSGQQNGIVSFVQTDPNNNDKPVNPNFEGMLDKTGAISAAKFRFDGTSGDYIYDALQVVMNGSMFLPLGTMAVYQMLRVVASNIDTYADYALMLDTETAVNPKIIIWDGQSYENAKALRPKAAWQGVAPEPMPTKNNEYNDTNEAWNARHPPNTDVIGRGLTFPPSPNGIYQVTEYFGIVLSRKPAMLVNYPMYFEPFYKGTLWDRFHWIDDPNKSMKMNRDFLLKIKLCCEDLKHCGVLNDASGVVLKEKIKLDNGYMQDGTIEEVTVSYDPEEETGRYIELKGTI